MSNKIIFKKQAKKITYTSKKRNVESDAMDEVNTVINEFSRKAKAEVDLFKENVDANYFTVILFNNHSQLEEFFQKIGLKPKDRQFVYGKDLCRKLNITLDTPDRKTPGNFKINKSILDLTL